MFPWGFGQAPQKQLAETPRETLLRRLGEGVPAELATRAAGIAWDEIKDDPDVDRALAEGEILLFERTRDSGVTGAIRAAMRQEAKTWQAKADIPTGTTLEDLLRG
jgi:hypothetical protein